LAPQEHRPTNASHCLADTPANPPENRILELLPAPGARLRPRQPLRPKGSLCAKYRQIGLGTT
jgi:hypothetical protein